MTFRAESSKDIFTNKLEKLEAAFAAKSGSLVDENLQVIQRGRFWWVLSLLRPFYAIFGRDPYSHVRIERVVNQFFKYVEANQSFLQEDPSLAARIQTQLLQIVKTRTGRDFSVYKAAIAGLGIKPQPVYSQPRIPQELAISSHRCIWPTDRPQIWEGMVVPTDPEAYATFTGILEKQFEEALTALANTHKLRAKGFGFKWRFSKETDPEGEGTKTRHLRIEIIANGSPIYFMERTLPLSISVETGGDTNIEAFWVHTKKVIAKGGERQVKRTFNLLTGKWFARKRVIRDDSSELELLKKFKSEPSRGIAEVSGLFEKATKKGPSPKIMVLQPLYDGNMEDFLVSKELDWNTKFGLMQDIANGLNALHRLCTEITFEDGSAPEKLKMFHMDLKPCNILVREQNGRLIAAITDFGYAGSFFKTGGSLGYKAPEEAALQQKENLTKSMVIHHNKNYGQAMDVWALGLLFMDLIVRNPRTFSISQQPGIFTQLPCIHQCIFTAQGNERFEIQRSLDQKIYDAHLASLQQEQVDDSIATIRAQESSAGFQQGQEAIWDVISRMLKVNPDRRIFVSDVLVLSSP